MNLYGNISYILSASCAPRCQANDVTLKLSAYKIKSCIFLFDKTENLRIIKYFIIFFFFLYNKDVSFCLIYYVQPLKTFLIILLCSYVAVGKAIGLLWLLNFVIKHTNKRQKNQSMKNYW